MSNAAVTNPSIPFDRFPAPWRSGVEHVIQTYRDREGPNLRAVYIRGTVASGEAVAGLSDVDSMAVVAPTGRAITQDGILDCPWETEEAEQFTRLHPFATSVEFYLVPENLLRAHRKSGFFFKAQATCVFGQDIAAQLPQYRLGSDAISHAFNIDRDIEVYRGICSTLSCVGQQTKYSRRLLKRLVRSAFELCMERAGFFTRDLDACVAAAARFFPEHAELLQQARKLMLRDVVDLGTMSAVADAMRAWMVTAAEDLYPGVPKNQDFSFIDDFGK